MTETKPSQTALATAYMRAAHQVLDQPPLLFADPLAVAVLGTGAAERIAAEARFRTPEARLLRSHVVLRSRFTEDRLAAAVARGVTQYVVLGAGLDTFAFRQPSWAQRFRVFEIDHPATHHFKKATLAGAGIQVPQNVTLGAVDSTRESLSEGLARSGVALDAPTFFSWLGVTMYLPRPAVVAAVAAMGRFGSGSEVVLTFMPPQPVAAQNDGAGARIAAVAALAASVGEPMISFFEESEVVEMLRAAGFGETYLLTPAEAQSRYFTGESIDLPAPQRTTIAAGVKP